MTGFALCWTSPPEAPVRVIAWSASHQRFDPQSGLVLADRQWRSYISGDGHLIVHEVRRDRRGRWKRHTPKIRPVD